MSSKSIFKRYNTKNVHWEYNKQIVNSQKNTFITLSKNNRFTNSSFGHFIVYYHNKKINNHFTHLVEIKSWKLDALVVQLYYFHDFPIIVLRASFLNDWNIILIIVSIPIPLPFRKMIQKVNGQTCKTRQAKKKLIQNFKRIDRRMWPVKDNSWISTGQPLDTRKYFCLNRNETASVEPPCSVKRKEKTKILQAFNMIFTKAT